MNIEFLWEAFLTALSGAPIAVIVTVVSLVIALPAGFILALLRMNDVPVIKQLARLYVSFVRGTPLIIQIFIIYTSVPIMLNIIFTKYQIDYNIYEIHPLWYAFLIFSFNTTAVLMEVFRSALHAVDQDQLEACQSIGLTTFQSYRRIIIPQVLVVALPNISTATINLIKATSLGYAISLSEITLRTKVAANAGYHYLEAYIAIFVVYLVLCSLVEYGFKKMEVRASRFKGTLA